MRQLISDGVKIQMCVTSPPYFGLRDYGVDGQIGLEKTPEEYIKTMVDAFRLVREMLKDDGTLWLNIGDSYWGSWGNYGNRPELSNKTNNQREKNCDYLPRRGWDNRQERPASAFKHSEIKYKDLIGIPWMLAFALRADGWYLRQDIIWAKPNPMPESVKDRCTKSHEYLFLLSKSPKYYFDGDAIAEPCKPSTLARVAQTNLPNQVGSNRVPGKTNGPMKACFGGRNKHSSYGTRIHSGNEDTGSYLERRANKRSVWFVSTKPYRGAHFATFPPDLIEPCVLAGSRPGDIVFDPFMGSGTTAQVARQHGRQYLGCELNPAYESLINERILRVSPQQTEQEQVLVSDLD
jgi:DNA modification methylase